MVAIVTPLDDILEPLHTNILIALLFVGITLLISIVLASIFASHFSNPFKKLAQDAYLICKLKLAETQECFSHITEVAEVEKAVMKMKTVLSSFQLYMPVMLVKKIVSSNKIAITGGENKELTLVFTDIQMTI